MEIVKKNPRRFLPEDLVIDAWAKLAPYFENLLQRKIDNKDQLIQWMLDRSEMEAVLEEDMAWRYIRMNIDTTDQKLAADFNFFVTEIEPKIAPISNELDKKLISSSFLSELNSEQYKIYVRGINKSIEIFREENVPILTELQQESQQYGVISAQMLVEVDGQEMTMQKAAKYLKDLNREKRKEVFELMNKRRGEDAQKLDELYSSLIKKRHQVAINAGFENYRDYMFAAMGRFDYTKEDCFQFHEAIKQEIVPICREFNLARKQKLGYEQLKPWDGEVDITGKPPLEPFKNAEELTGKTVGCLSKIDPYFANCVATMREMNHLDLESKKGKAPGGFLYPLYEIGVPFIYMNAVGSFRDLITMVHESGHAIHSFLSKDLELTGFKSTPSEVAELASMSMELLTMNYWNEFFENEEELKRAKKEHLESLITILPWIALVDKFQHWVYENPFHSVAERHQKWEEFSDFFSTGVTDWSGYENIKKISYQKQLHIYEVPFYYIEYGMAQLGAIAVWKKLYNKWQSGS
jgi:oligoendopeptidase F